MNSGDTRAAVHGWMDAGSWRHFVESVSKLLRLVRIQRKTKELRVRETAALGERRFLALVEWNNEKLLLGVTPGAITLLKTQKAETDPQDAAKEGSEG